MNEFHKKPSTGNRPPFDSGEIGENKMPFNAQAYMSSWQSFREMNQAAWTKQTLQHAATHLMSEYEPTASTLGHSHYCYSGDLAAVALLNKLAESL